MEHLTSEKGRTCQLNELNTNKLDSDDLYLKLRYVYNEKIRTIMFCKTKTFWRKKPKRLKMLNVKFAANVTSNHHPNTLTHTNTNMRVYRVKCINVVLLIFRKNIYYILKDPFLSLRKAEYHKLKIFLFNWGMV